MGIPHRSSFKFHAYVILYAVANYIISLTEALHYSNNNIVLKNPEPQGPPKGAQSSHFGHQHVPQGLHFLGGEPWAPFCGQTPRFPTWHLKKATQEEISLDLCNITDRFGFCFQKHLEIPSKRSNVSWCSSAKILF